MEYGIKKRIKQTHKAKSFPFKKSWIYNVGSTQLENLNHLYDIQLYYRIRMQTAERRLTPAFINRLTPTGHVMYHQFNIQQL
jgi:hypothetical protein